ncbi:MAG: hypothetical protein V7K69_03065 [Nostoc sp.]
MNFEIIGDITNLEIIAVGNSIRELELCVKLMVQDGGGNLKALQPLA